MRTVCRIVGFLALVLWFPALANAQGAPELGGPFSRQPLLDAPFQADVATTIRDQHPDGTTRTISVTGRYFRDSRGQVRAELDTPWGPYIILAKTGTEGVQFYRLNPNSRTYMNANVLVATWLFNAEAGLAVPAASSCFEGSFAAPGASESERLKSVNAEVLPELGIVRASSRVANEPTTEKKGSGVQRSSAYELTNVRLEEPPAKLFEVPDDYTLVPSSPAAPLVRWTPSWSQSPDRCNSWKTAQR